MTRPDPLPTVVRNLIDRHHMNPRPAPTTSGGWAWECKCGTTTMPTHWRQSVRDATDHANECDLAEHPGICVNCGDQEATRQHQLCGDCQEALDIDRAGRNAT
jgi:hypothetical protein